MMNHLFYLRFTLLVIVTVFISCGKEEPANIISPYEKMQLEAVNFISQPSFSGDSMFEKLTSAKATLQRYYVDTKQLYFTCDSAYYTDANLNKFVMSKDSITRAKAVNGELVLDTKHFNDPGKAFFKMPVSNFKVDSTKVISMNYKEGTYKVTLPQILNFTYLRSTFGGGAIAITEEKSHFMNHGSVVAKSKEPSLYAFVKQITKNEQTPEAKAQKLLDFVTHEITYSEKEATNGYETIKRPDEVLFTRNSDCSGKAILYASLIEQLGVKWCLLYFEGHICVGVEGKYEVEHPLKFNIHNREYYIAEITDPHAIIGSDSWGGEMNEGNLQYYQISDSIGDVVDYKTKHKLDFVRGKAKS